MKYITKELKLFSLNGEDLSTYFSQIQIIISWNKIHHSKYLLLCSTLPISLTSQYQENHLFFDRYFLCMHKQVTRKQNQWVPQSVIQNFLFTIPNITQRLLSHHTTINRPLHFPNTPHSKTIHNFCIFKKTKQKK